MPRRLQRLCQTQKTAENRDFFFVVAALAIQAESTIGKIHQVSARDLGQSLVTVPCLGGSGGGGTIALSCAQQEVPA
jgi:hypothetical protein